MRKNGVTDMTRPATTPLSASLDTVKNGLRHAIACQPRRHRRRAQAARARRQPHRGRKPPWFKVPAPGGPRYRELQKLIEAENLHTVCQEAACPNIGECWQRGTATFMILGDTCTRRCGFCNVKTGKPTWNDPLEPARVARSVARMGLRHAVITSVDRDDLPDYGAGAFVGVIRQIRRQSPRTKIEVLTPDFRGEEMPLAKVIAERPDVFNHNVEVVPRLYPVARRGSTFERSVRVLRNAKEIGGDEVVTKSGLMVGLGETFEEMVDALGTLRENHVQVLTVGQYLRPTEHHLPIVRYWHPDEFAALERGRLRAWVRARRRRPARAQQLPRRPARRPGRARARAARRSAAAAGHEPSHQARHAMPLGGRPLASPPRLSRRARSAPPWPRPAAARAGSAAGRPRPRQPASTSCSSSSSAIAIFGHGLGALVIIALVVLSLVYTNVAPRARGAGLTASRRGRAAAAPDRPPRAAGRAGRRRGRRGGPRVRTRAVRRAGRGSCSPQSRPPGTPPTARRLQRLVGPGLLTEWERRLDDFDAAGLAQPGRGRRSATVEYVGLAPRQRRGDQVVVRIEARLRDYVEDAGGHRIAPAGAFGDSSRCANSGRWHSRDGALAPGLDRAGCRGLPRAQRAAGRHPLVRRAGAARRGARRGRGRRRCPRRHQRRRGCRPRLRRATPARRPSISASPTAASPPTSSRSRRAPGGRGLGAGRRRRRQPRCARSPPRRRCRELLHPGDPSAPHGSSSAARRSSRSRSPGFDPAATPPTMTHRGRDQGAALHRGPRDHGGAQRHPLPRPRAFAERWTFALAGDDAQPWRIVAAERPSPRAEPSAGRGENLTGPRRPGQLTCSDRCSRSRTTSRPTGSRWSPSR